MKEHSASAKPVKNQGFILGEAVKDSFGMAFSNTNDASDLYTCHGVELVLKHRDAKYGKLPPVITAVKPEKWRYDLLTFNMPELCSTSFVCLIEFFMLLN